MGRVKAWRRYPEPHIWLDTVGRNVVPEEDMTESEIEAYMNGQPSFTVYLYDKSPNMITIHEGVSDAT